MLIVFYSFFLVLAILNSDLCEKSVMIDRERSTHPWTWHQRRFVTLVSPASHSAPLVVYDMGIFHNSIQLLFLIVLYVKFPHRLLLAAKVGAKDYRYSRHCNSIIYRLSTLGIPAAELGVIGCDGTVTNTIWRYSFDWTAWGISMICRSVIYF